MMVIRSAAEKKSESIEKASAVLVKGGFPLLREARPLLHGRLTAASAIISLASLLYLFLEIAVRPGYLIGFHVSHCLLTALLAGFLYGTMTLTLNQLRSIELFLFGFTAFFLASKEYTKLLDALRGPDGENFLLIAASVLFYFFCLVVIYVLFVPNQASRAVWMALGLSVTPLAMFGLLNVRHPELRQVLWMLLSWDRLTVLLLMMGAGALVSLYGAYAISAIREDALEARRFGQYRLTERIGGGGVGEVWKAEHGTLARPAAIKVIRVRGDDGDRADVEMQLRRFEREAQATAMLTSPHTIQLFDFGTTQDGVFYYVMELLEGLDLETLVSRFGPVAPERLVHFLLGACDSLAEAHQNGLIHRDVKPANIYACKVGIEYDFIKILDFGLVKSEHYEKDVRLTAVGIVSGTPAYIAPEIAMGKHTIDERADLYSLGCVAYWLITGQLLFGGSSAMEIVANHIKSDPVPPSKRTELDLPRRLEELILWCLAKDPANRPSSALEFRQALADCRLEETWTQVRAEAWWKGHGLLF